MNMQALLRGLLNRNGYSVNKLAKEVGVSHVTMGRWLSGNAVPTPESCRMVARVADLPVAKVLSYAGHLPPITQDMLPGLPEFREYMSKRYPGRLDDDLITMVADLLERKKSHGTSRVL